MPRTDTSVQAGNNSTRNAPRTQNLPKHLHQMSHYPVGSKELYQISFDAVVRKNYGAEPSKLDFSRCYRAVHPLIALGMAIADLYINNYSSAINVESIRIIKP